MLKTVFLKEMEEMMLMMEVMGENKLMMMKKIKMMMVKMMKTMKKKMTMKFKKMKMMIKKMTTIMKKRKKKINKKYNLEKIFQIPVLRMIIIPLMILLIILQKFIF